MPNSTVKEIQAILSKPKLPFQDTHYTTEYKVGGQTYQIALYNHPAQFATMIMNWVAHTYFYGVYIVAPMGHGKSKIAQTIAHQCHLKDPRFTVVWAGEWEFTHQQQFYESLPKQPVIIIYEDISGALKKLPEREIEANFASLTKVRWILDEVNGEIPVIQIVVGHYSKNLDKQVRSLMSMVCYAGFGNEEQTNIDTLAPKNSPAYNTLLQFGEIYSTMFDKGKFDLYVNRKKITYETSKPFRPCAVITKTRGKIILYTKDDVCEKCKMKNYQKIVPAQEIFDKIKKAYNNQGILALKIYLQKHGNHNALHPTVASALNFIEQELGNHFAFNKDEMVDVIWKESKKVRPKRIYNKVKKNNQIIDELGKIAVLKEKPSNTIINSTEIPLTSNEQFLANEF